MGKIFAFILPLILSFAVSCSMLEEKTYSDMNVDDIYGSESDVDASTMGIYETIINNSMYTLPTMLGNISSTANTKFVYIVSGGIHTETSHLEVYWSGNYTMIRRANEVIANLADSPLEDEVKQPYMAEAMALRAYAYFRLLRFWGDIPFRLAERDSWQSSFKLTPMEDIYRFIIADLEWALGHIWEPGVKPRGRLDKVGAEMILADVYLTCASSARSYNPATSARALKPYYDAFDDVKEAYWTRVKELSQAVIDNGYYALETEDWTKLWGYAQGYDSRSNREHIWSSQTVPGVIGSKTYFKYTPTYSEYCPGQTVGELFMTYDWATSFDRKDVRFTDGIIWEYKDKRYYPHTNGTYFIEVWPRDLNNREAVLSGNMKTDKDTTWRYHSYKRLQTKKFYDMTYEVTNNAIGPAIQMPYYRMAEAYLFYAEAENELNSCTQDAVDKINPIRTRVGLEGYQAGQFSREEFRDRIIDEREWEFAMEGKDIFTIMRCGVLEERQANKEVAWDGNEGVSGNPRPRTADNYWLPYPRAERSANYELKDIVRMDYE